jgi:undecaprenyl-diphosphatase
MSFFSAILLGILQGLTEFIPVSSSGHLVLFQKIFEKAGGLSANVVSFDVALHIATLVAVIAVMKDDILAILKKPFSKLTLMILVACIPTGLIGVLFKDLIEELFKSGKSIGVEFIVTGLILWLAESIKTKNKGLREINIVDALVIGTAQGIAIMPAISRSGLTLAGGLFRGLNREFALKFSFLVSIPAIIGAALPDIYHMFKGSAEASGGIGTMPLIVGVLAAGISGYFAIKYMLKVFTKASLKVFSYYVFVLGALVVLDQFVFHIFFN